jgi:hypothetical protein
LGGSQIRSSPEDFQNLERSGSPLAQHREAAAIAYTLIETAKLNGIDLQAWLADTLARIPDYKINRVDDLLPWKSAS